MKNKCFFSILVLFLACGLAFAETELEKELKKLREAGIPTTLEEFVPPNIPVEENAALVYQKVFDMLEKNKEDIDKIKQLPSYSDIS